MNNLSFIPQFVSVSDLQRHYPKILKLLKDKQQPLLILKKQPRGNHYCPWFLSNTYGKSPKIWRRNGFKGNRRL